MKKLVIIATILFFLSVMNYFSYRFMRIGSWLENHQKKGDLKTKPPVEYFPIDSEAIYVQALMTANVIEKEILLKEAILYSPGWVGPYIALLEISIQTNAPDNKIRELFKITHNLEPMNTTTIMNFGYYLVQTGEWEEAFSYLVESLHQSESVQQRILETLLFIEEDVDRIITAIPEDPETYSILARLLSGRGLFEEALNLLLKARELAEDRAPFSLKIVKLLSSKLQRYEEAKIIAFEVLQDEDLSRDEELEYLFIIVEVLRNLDEWDKARTIADKIETLCPSDHQCLYQLSLFYQRIKDPYMAEKMMEKAILWDADNARYHERLGDLFHTNNKIKLAIDEYRQAKQILSSPLEKEKNQKNIERIEKKMQPLLMKLIDLQSYSVPPS